MKKDLNEEYKNEISSILTQIKEARQEKNLTQEKVAEKLGISVTSYKKIESGKTELKVSTMMFLMQLFDIDKIKNTNETTFLNIEESDIKQMMLDIREIKGKLGKVEAKMNDVSTLTEFMKLVASTNKTKEIE